MGVGCVWGGSQHLLNQVSITSLQSSPPPTPFNTLQPPRSHQPPAGFQAPPTCVTFDAGGRQNKSYFMAFENIVMKNEQCMQTIGLIRINQFTLKHKGL